MLEKFVGFNDWQEGCTPAKRDIKILNNTIRRFYSDKDNQSKQDKIDNQPKDESWSHEVIMPIDLYISKFQNDIDLLMTPTKFRSIYMNKIDKNIDLISKMLNDDNKDIVYVSRWMRIPPKTFIKLMNKYYDWIKNKQNKQKLKIANQIDRLQNIKGLIQVYIGLNRGRCINTKGILDFIKTWNL